MTSNRSIGAGERRVEPHDSLDDFPTPPWAARALCEHLIREFGFDLSSLFAWEPACNRGSFARGISDYFGAVHCSDIHDYGLLSDFTPTDFLLWGSEPKQSIDVVATNPPFRLAKEFILRALQIAKSCAAFIVRNAFVEGETRFQNLFEKNPPTQLLYFSERVVMLKGRLIRANEVDPVATRDKGKEVKASTNRATMAAIWIKDHERLPCAWVPPGSRLRLERKGDYDL